MKKFLLICILLLVIAGSGCSKKTKEDSFQSIVESSVKSSKEVSEVKRDIGELLEDTFISLWKSDTVYIDVEMTVEGDVKDTEKSGENEVSVYKYIIAADKNQELAMLNMEQPDGTKVHYIINKDKIYDINDEEKKYKLIEYKNTTEDFIKAYTKDMNLGVSESMKLSDFGKTEFNGNDNIDFEKYNISMSDNTSSGITITYYFKNKNPYAEVMQSDRGKTVFMFKAVSDKIEKSEIFEIPSDYLNSTEY